MGTAYISGIRRNSGFSVAVHLGFACDAGAGFGHGADIRFGGSAAIVITVRLAAAGICAGAPVCCPITDALFFTGTGAFHAGICVARDGSVDSAAVVRCKIPFQQGSVNRLGADKAAQ